MTHKKTLNIILLLLLSFVCQEMWQMFKTETFQVPFIAINYSIEVQWYVKELGIKMAFFVVGVVLYMLTRLYFDIRVVVVSYLYYAIVDLALFFVCYNLWSYVLVYLSTMLFGILYWYYKKFGAAFSKLSKGQSVQASVARKDDSSSTVKYIKRNLEVRVD